MAICKNYLKIAYTVTGHKTALMTRLRCKQWSCDYCAAKNARTWQYWLIKRLPEVSQEWYLVTLTAREDERTHVGSLKNIRERIDKLIKRAKRVFGEDIEYVRVYEKHPSSEAVHVHFIMCGLSPYVAIGYSQKLQPMAFGVLTRASRNGVWSTKTWFKKNADALQMGYIVDIKRLEGSPEQAAFYVTKYLTKAQHELHVKGLRHVQVTRGIGSPPHEDNKAWQTASYITANMFQPNASIKDLNTGETINNDYWEQHGFYPYED